MSFGSDPLGDLAGLLAESASPSEYEAARLTWLGRAIGFEASYFGAATPQQRMAPVVSGVDVERVEQCEAHAERYWQDRVRLERAALSADGAVADHDAFSARARDRMPFYREVVSGHGIRATAVAIMRLRGQISGCIFLGRTSRGARFGGELGLLRRALPLLALAEAAHLAPTAHAAKALESLDLTPREQAVLRLVCRGWTNAQIAAQLGSSPRTVKNQVSAILRKARVSNRTQLTAELARRTSL